MQSSSLRAVSGGFDENVGEKKRKAPNNVQSQSNNNVSAGHNSSSPERKQRRMERDAIANRPITKHNSSSSNENKKDSPPLNNQSKPNPKTSATNDKKQQDGMNGLGTNNSNSTRGVINKILQGVVDESTDEGCVTEPDTADTPSISSENVVSSALGTAVLATTAAIAADDVSDATLAVAVAVAVMPQQSLLRIVAPREANEEPRSGATENAWLVNDTLALKDGAVKEMMSPRSPIAPAMSMPFQNAMLASLNDVTIHKNIKQDVMNPSDKAENEDGDKKKSIRTLVAHHADCLGHQTAELHQEAPQRVTAILRKLRSTYGDDVLEFCDRFEMATKEQIMRVHSKDYVEFVFGLHDEMAAMAQLAKDGDVRVLQVALTPRVQRHVYRLDEMDVKSDRYCDTSFSQGSLHAATRSAGAVCHAIDKVMSGQSRNAFCVVRPPGHHAGVDGLIAEAKSCGFCIFNSVAIGAAHAIAEHSDTVKRIAIVDLDVHHGNGTQEIVRERFQKPEQFFFFSIHLYEGTHAQAFYPASGGESFVSENVHNAGVKPLWTQPRKSSRLRRKGTDTTETEGSQQQQVETKKNETSVKQQQQQQASSASSADQYTNTPTSADAAQYGKLAFQAHINNKLVPSLRAFKPDLILISAGFDAGHNDMGCVLGKMGSWSSGSDLEPEDFHWITRKIMTVADECCKGRVVSVLEGGYGQRLLEGRRVTICRKSLALNAAAHVDAMLTPANTNSKAADEQQRTSTRRLRSRTPTTQVE